MSKPIDPAIAREKEKARLAKPNKGTVAHDEMAHNKLDLRSDNVNARLENPLAGISLERLQEMGRAFALEKGLEEHAEEFAKGAMVAQDPLAYESLPMLNDEDRRVLGREVTHKWDHPKALYFLVVMCSISAAVQGMDESVTNGANLFWAPQFGLDTDPATAGAAASNNQWLLGLTAGAPYLCCAVLGCWLTAPLNNWFGRRGAIFITATLSALTCIWGACTNSWQHLFVSRLVLGLGIGPKSATVPVYGAETAPPLIRGALVMQWQVWTAFGIMLGTVSSLAFYKVPDPTNAAITGLNWRLMLGSAAFPAFFVMAQVYFCPESPRWLIGKGRYGKAYESLCRLRHTKLQAARDLFMINALLEEEASISTGRSAIVEMFAVARNRRAALASGIVMFMQQFCGINVIAYYSSTIFRQAGFGEIEALGATLGFGALNWIAAAPALYTIDTFGRRALLLTTFPIMSLALLIVALSFLIEAQTARTAMTATFVYVHCIAYSPGEGPVPFTYSAEAFPLYIRDVGMSYATALTWLFNFILALTFPRLLDAFTPSGAFGWYAAWNMIGWTLVLFFVPETKSLTLEELDQVFSVPTKSHAAYQARQVPYFIGKYIMRKDMGSPEQLYHWENPSIERVQSIPHFTGVRGDMQA
ncbi:and other transporter-domain-containing protein [Leucosporidium creatinivorum]|uniref:And other transporter-domain-containing protein n=1 Tax=Leucosporidium creatinivorum TaxID=106004 RepID=A0A1Y2FRT1_9BASI|nr:and other transporter-domain-containing protein [Leucosporidium creatinivorum]